MSTLDYAAVYENEFRTSRRVRRAIARIIWAGLFVVRPGLAMDILQSR
jgi:hypothetical protein